MEGYFSELLPKVSSSGSLNTRSGNHGAAMYDTGYLSSNTKPDLDTKQAEDVAGRERITMMGKDSEHYIINGIYELLKTKNALCMLGILMSINQDTSLHESHIKDTLQDDTIEELKIPLDRNNETCSISENSGTEDTLDTPIDLTKNDDDPQGMFCTNAVM